MTATPQPTGSPQRFIGQTVLVTGAARGIGLVTAARFAAEGANVVIVDLHGPAAVQAAEQLRRTDATASLGIACDVSQPEQVEACVAQTLATFHRLDVVVNNAGLMTFKPFSELCLADWLKVLQVDLLGAFLFIKQSFLHMQRGGAVVNIASIHAYETSPHVAPYAAAKAALISMTRSAAIEGKAQGIRVNAVLPGAVDTPMLWENPNIKAGIEKLNPDDVGRPEDLAAVIAFLASADAAFVQGTAVVVDGGRIIKL